VGVEVDQADRAVDGGAGTGLGLGDRVVAAEDDGHGAGAEHGGDRRLDRAVRADGSAGRTGASPKSTTRSSSRSASTPASRCGRGQQLALRMARGPNLVPGLSEVSSSIGAPTMAASAPASSAGSSVYGEAGEGEPGGWNLRAVAAWTTVAWPYSATSAISIEISA
jgi:hypothetical protein